MGDAVASKEFEAGLSLLDMMQRPSDASSSGSESVASTTTPMPTKRRARQAATPRAVKKAKSALATGSLLLAAAQQVDPLEAEENEEDEEEDEGWADPSAGGVVRRNAQLTSLSHDLTIEQLREHFNKPIVEVAKEFGICTTFLKKICRRCGIKRWPHRQIRSLTRTIEMLHQAEANATSVPEKAKYAAQIARVEAKKRAVIDNPDANGKLERVKKSALHRSGSPGSRKNPSADAGSSRSTVAGDEPMLQPDLLHAVAAAAAAASAVLQTAGTAELQVATATEAEAAAAEALLFSASPRTPVASIDVTMPAVALDSTPVPAITPTATAVPDPNAGQATISPSHRKLLTVPKGEGDSRARTSSFGSLDDLDDGEPPLPASAVLCEVEPPQASEDPSAASILTASVVCGVMS